MKPTYVVHYPEGNQGKMVLCKNSWQATEVAKTISKAFNKAIEITREPVPYKVKKMVLSL